MRKWIAMIGVVAFLIFIMGGCSTAPKETLTSIEIGTLKGPSGVSLLKMMDTANPIGEGVAVNYSVEAQPDVLTAKLLAGELDAATIPTNTAAILFNKGADYKIVAMNTWGVLYIIGTDPAIQTMADLNGKAISAVGQGTTPDLLMQYLMMQSGMDPEADVTVDYSLPHQELATAMIAGNKTLAMLPEPFVTMVTMQNPEVKVLIDIQKEWSANTPGGGPLPQTCLVMKGSLLEKYPDQANQLLEVYRHSIAFANENPVEAGVLAEKLELFPKAKIIEMAIPRLMLDAKPMAESKPLIQSYFETLYDLAPESIGGKLPDESLYYLK